jgi:hypothetical protein
VAVGLDEGEARRGNRATNDSAALREASQQSVIISPAATELPGSQLSRSGRAAPQR